MINKYFKRDDLKVCDLQYQISFDNVLYFNIDDIVFLKSNPEFPLKVIGINLIFNEVYCIDNNKKEYKFYPQMILHYKWISLIIFKKRWKMSLN